MSFQEPHAYQPAAAEKAQDDIAAAPNKVHVRQGDDVAAVQRHTDALQALSRAQALLATSKGSSVVACERYDATARFMKWGNHFFAKHDSCCTFAGTEATAVLRAKQRSDDKGKVVIVDEHCRIRAINDHEGRPFAMGIFNKSPPEHVFAFESATLRDTWVAMLQVRLCACMCAIALAFTLDV